MNKAPEEKSQAMASVALNVAKKVLKALESHGFEARLAGGCVRDRLMGIDPKDFDVATNALPAHVLNIFTKDGFKAIPTGIDHGTITVVQAGIPIEVTTLREDVETDGRRAVVRFGESFEADAQRRDFTINAMYEALDGQVFDFFGGRKDLESKRLKFVGQADARVREDYLRILRLFRFWSRFGFMPDNDALIASQNLAPGLSRISQERITSELMQILSGNQRSAAFERLHKLRILSVILPEVDPMDHAVKALSADTLIEPEELRPVGALATLFLCSILRRPAIEIVQKIRLSNNQSKLISFAVDGRNMIPDENEDAATKMSFIDQAEAIGGNGSFLKFFVPVWAASKLDAKTHQSVVACQELELSAGELRRAKPLMSADEIMSLMKIPAGKGVGILLKAMMRKQRNREVVTKFEAGQWLKKSGSQMLADENA